MQVVIEKQSAKSIQTRDSQKTSGQTQQSKKRGKTREINLTAREFIFPKLS